MTQETQNEHDLEVVKFYTHARKFPQLVGRWTNGRKIWGGPYTSTQIVVGGAALFVGSKTTDLWARGSFLTNLVLAAGFLFAVVYLTGKIPLGSRSPLSVGLGTWKAFTAPRSGTVNGRKVQIRRPHTIRLGTAYALSEVPEPAETPLEPAETPQAVSRPRWPSQAPAARMPALSGVQALLAAAPSPIKEDQA